MKHHLPCIDNLSPEVSIAPQSLSCLLRTSRDLPLLFMLVFAALGVQAETLSVRWSGTQLEVHWTNGVLQQALTPAGPWIDVPGNSTQSHRVDPCDNARFFRTRPGIRLARTGQTLSYAPRDDGNLQRGVGWPSPRFTDNRDGTVSDNLTGLMWLKDADCILTAHPSFDTDDLAGDGRVTWQHALDFVSAINAGRFADCSSGYSDWRLPNAAELRSLNDYSSFATPSILQGHPFTNSNYWSFWSSTTVPDEHGYALMAEMHWNGGTMYSADKPNHYGVWPVRSWQTVNAPAPVAQTGQTRCYDALGQLTPCTDSGQDGAQQAGIQSPSPRFALGASGQTLIDRLTHLEWATSPESAPMTWSSAVSFATNSSLCGYTDWRLPNINELASLLHYEEPSRWLQAQGFNNLAVYDYWSSTTLAGHPGWAWGIGLRGGGTAVAPKGWPCFVWLVRDP